MVCGGGPAGWVAAVSAARAGKKTALIERYGFLGGTATGGIVVPLSGFYFKGERVVGGIAWEFVQRLCELGAAKVELPKGHISVNLEYYKLISEQMVRESGVTLYTNSYISDIVADDGKISHVIIENKNGSEAISGSCFIDATGDGDICYMVGMPMLPAVQELQPVSLCFILGGVNTDTELLQGYIHHDGKNGKPSCHDIIRSRLTELSANTDIPQFGGPWFNTLLKGNSLAVNMTRTSVDATDREALSRAEAELREDMFKLVNILRKEFEEFRACEIIFSGVNAGIRETRHIKGLHTVSYTDVINGTEFYCPVVHCAHPMDIHAAKGSGQSVSPLSADCYVPYEAMVAKGFPNLIAAGRCISAQREPYASIRVQGTVMCIGEAAGLAASLCLDTDTSVTDISRDALKELIRTRNFVL